jgi:hypothetical protein
MACLYRSPELLVLSIVEHYVVLNARDPEAYLVGLQELSRDNYCRYLTSLNSKSILTVDKAM